MPTMGDQNDTTAAYRLNVRFGDEILQAGFTTVPNLLLRYQAALGISSSEFNFILQVWYHWWDQKDPYPALGTIAERMSQSRRQVRRYSESLRDKGFLMVRERREPGLGQVTSEYDFTPLLDQLRLLYREEQGSINTGRTNMTAPPRTDLTEGGRTILTEAPRTSMSSEEYTEQKDTDNKNTQIQQDTIISNRFESVANLQKPSSFQNSKKRDETQKSGERVDGGSSPQAGGSKQLTAVGDVLSTRTLPSPAKNTPRRPKKRARTADNADDQSYSVPAESAPPRAARGRPPKATEQIEAVLEQISDEFHDAEHLPSNIGQAARLWKSSGLNEATFVGRLYEARSITKDYGMSINKKASGEAGEWGQRNRMPYFFAVVRDLLGMKETRQGAAESS